MLDPNGFKSKVQARALDIKDCRTVREADLLAAEARGFVSAAREFNLITHGDLKKRLADIEKALEETHRVLGRSAA